MARFASGDDQPREAMSWIGRWQTRKGSPKPDRRLKGRRPRRSTARLQAGFRRSIGICHRDAADGVIEVRLAYAKTGVAGSLGVMSRRLGPSAVRRAARGEAAASRLCVAPLRAVQGRRSALKRHIGGQAKTSTGLYPPIRGRAIREASTTTESAPSRLPAHVRADRPRRLGLNNVCNVAILVA